MLTTLSSLQHQTFSVADCMVMWCPHRLSPLSHNYVQPTFRYILEQLTLAAVQHIVYKHCLGVIAVSVKF